MRRNWKRGKSFSKKYDEFLKKREQNGNVFRLIDEVMQMSTLIALKKEQGKLQTLTIDEKNSRAFIDGQECVLTQQEFYLLQELAQNADRPVSREQLLREAWGYVSPGETRTVDVHIQRLRRKLGFACIETVYRFGYRLRACAV